MQDVNTIKARIEAQMDLIDCANIKIHDLVSSLTAACESPKAPLKGKPRTRRTKAQMLAAREPSTVTELVAPKGIRRARSRKLADLTNAAE